MRYWLEKSTLNRKQNLQNLAIPIMLCSLMSYDCHKINPNINWPTSKNPPVGAVFSLSCHPLISKTPFCFSTEVYDVCFFIFFFFSTVLSSRLLGNFLIIFSVFKSVLCWLSELEWNVVISLNRIPRILFSHQLVW